ncbi:enoyl-ACP reductase-like protein [Paraburkholderia silvatlantica]|uniref:Enoyl-ACP reductase-like protein n=2 Tax=Paraburkholderia silvatlantica TaxID=321895 RepID=A0A2V4T136_9BURK|nr:enoyl-ACP reductase-like protein [Paraburkholderia silvatlantica]
MAGMTERLSNFHQEFSDGCHHTPGSAQDISLRDKHGRTPVRWQDRDRRGGICQCRQGAGGIVGAGRRRRVDSLQLGFEERPGGRDSCGCARARATMVAAFAPTYAGYAGSKAPLEHFSKALARELGGRGITVNCIAPGPLDTSFSYPAESDENIAWLRSMSIDGGLGNIVDVTGLALFLVSPEARWMTGTTSHINGGIVSPINRMERMLREHQGEFCAALHRDFGKPPFEQLFEITVPLGVIRYYRENLKELMAPTRRRWLQRYGQVLRKGRLRCVEQRQVAVDRQSGPGPRCVPAVRREGHCRAPERIFVGYGGSPCRKENETCTCCW